MYRVTAYFKNRKVSEMFSNIYDAIDFRDSADAHYPNRVTFEEGIFSMREWVYTSWVGVMDAKKSPLRHIPDTNTRHLILQILAWMWCIVFSFYIGSFVVFGISAIAHVMLLGAIAITVGTFETAKRNPKVFNIRPGYHSVSRTRQYMWQNGRKVKLDPNDPGGEHE